MRKETILHLIKLHFLTTSQIIPTISIFLWFSILGCTSLSTVTDRSNTTMDHLDYVILLHGLGRTNRSMSALASYLSNRGFNVLNINYPSRHHPIEELIKHVQDQIEKHEIQSAHRLHFVTHSLGGILTRFYLKNNPLQNLGRVVMISPPNQGSELVDALKNRPIFQLITGPAGQQLGTEASSIPNQLGAVNFELGVITGNRSFNPLYSFMIPGSDDGKVAVERAKVAGMTDFLVVPYTHTFIMQRRRVMEQVVYFLNWGKFQH